MVIGLAVPDLEWAVSMVLAYGPLVEVLAPGELRQMVIERAAAIMRQYDQV